MNRTTLAARLLSAALLTALVPVSLPATAIWQPDAAVVTARGEWTADTRNWWSTDEGPRLQLNLRSDEGTNNVGFGVSFGELVGLSPAVQSGVVDDARFSWVKEAGTFRFQGTFENGRGNGSFTFSAAPEYVSAMGALGYRNLSSADLLRLAVLDVTQAYVRGLATVGYEALDLDELVKMRVHRVTPEFITALADRGYRGIDTEDLVKMRIHRVSAAEIDDYKKLGYSGMDTDDLVKMRIHKVTPAFIQEIHNAGYQTVSLEQLVKLRIHRVNGQFIEDLKADGYQNLTVSDILDLAIRGPRFSRVRRPPGRQ